MPCAFIHADLLHAAANNLFQDWATPLADIVPSFSNAADLSIQSPQEPKAYTPVSISVLTPAAYPPSSIHTV